MLNLEYENKIIEQKLKYKKIKSNLECLIYTNKLQMQKLPDITDFDIVVPRVKHSDLFSLYYNKKTESYAFISQSTNKTYNAYILDYSNEELVDTFIKNIRLEDEKSGLKTKSGFSTLGWLILIIGSILSIAGMLGNPLGMFLMILLFVLISSLFLGLGSIISRLKRFEELK